MACVFKQYNARMKQMRYHWRKSLSRKEILNRGPTSCKEVRQIGSKMVHWLLTSGAPAKSTPSRFDTPVPPVSLVSLVARDPRSVDARRTADAVARRPLGSVRG